MRRLISPFLVALMAMAGAAFADQPRVVAGLGSQMSVDSAEASLRYIAPDPMVWQLHPAFGLSWAKNGSGWVGMGAALTVGEGDGWFMRVTSMVGAYRRGSGRDLGGAFQFRNALDLGYRWDSGLEAGFGADHRSNAGLRDPNPGLNSVYLFASIPLK